MSGLQQRLLPFLLVKRIKSTRQKNCASLPKIEEMRKELRVGSMSFYVLNLEKHIFMAFLSPGEIKIFIEKN